MKYKTCSLLLALGVSSLGYAAPKTKLDLARGWGINEEAAIVKLWPRAARPRLLIPKVVSAPEIDGKQDDAMWQKASSIDFFISCKGFNSKPPLRFGVDELVGRTWAKLCYDSKNLYIYAYCHEDHAGWLQKSMVGRDTSTWKDDCVEFFFDRDGDQKNIIHAIINPVPTIYDALEKPSGENIGKKWNFDGEQIAVDTGEDYWALEIAFPLKSLGGEPKPGETWRFNLCRQRRAAAQVAIWSYGTWTGNSEGFQVPEQMGDIVFGLGASRIRVPEEPFFGVSEFEFTIRNDGDKALRLLGSVEIVSSAKRELTKPMSFTVPSGKEVTGKIPFTITDEGIQYASLIVKQGDQPLLVQRRGLYIRPISPTLDAILPRAEKLVAKAESDEFRESISAYLEELKQVKADVESFKQKLTPRPSDLSNYAEWFNLYGRAQSFSGKSTYVVWSKSPYLPTSPADFPAKMEDIGEIVVKACVNEWEHAAIMISNLTDESLNIIVKGDLPGLIDVRAPLATSMKTVVKENPDALGYETVRGFNLPGKTGEPLIRLGQLRELLLLPLSTRQLFLTFNTKGMKPGRRGGRLSLYTLNKSYGVKHIPVRLEIAPFEIPDTAELGVHCYNYPSSDVHLRDLLEHKVNMIFGADNGKFRVDKDGNFRHEVEKPALDAMNRLRLGGRKGWAYGFCRAYHEWAQKNKLKPGDGKYEEYWREAVRAQVEAFRKAGFKDDEYYICAWDEVKAKNVDLCVHLLKILREEAPRMKIANTIQCSKSEQKKQFPYVDAWVAAGGFYWDAKWADELRKAGKELWAYTCRTPVRAQNPLGYYRMAGWRAIKARMRGISFFAYSYLIYDIDGEVVPTRGWEAWREGVEDWQHWNRLQKEITRVRKAGREKEATKAERAVAEAIDAVFKFGTHPKDSIELDETIERAKQTFANEITRLGRLN